MNTTFKKILLYIGLPAVLLISVAANAPTDKYFEIVRNLDIFATLYKEVNQYYVDDVNPSKMMNTAIEAMLESLDPYTNYIPEDDIEDFRTQMTGQYGGIGCVIGTRDEKCLVLMPYEGFPAFKAGFTIGDEIVSVDGIEMKGKSTSDVSKVLKGQAGTTVKVMLLKVGATTAQEVLLTRERIQVKSVPYYGMVNSTIGVIKLSEFTGNASKDVRAALIELKEKGAKSIILDLRGNPGGLLTEAINLSNMFVDKGKLVVFTKGKISEWNKEYHAESIPDDINIPIAVLINSRSASASEIVSGVIQDYDRGVIVGQRSFGKGLVQSTRPLSYNAQLKVTTAKYYTPSGRCIQAIDYSNKNEDGSVGKIPDSLQHEFKTANGRIVKDGGGVLPDFVVETEKYPAIVVSLLNKNLFFDYASQYYITHPKIGDAKTFTITDQEYKAFVKWLEGKDYDYETSIEKSLKELEEEAKKEKKLEELKPHLDEFKKQIFHSKSDDLEHYKIDVKRVLEEEIVSRYYFQKGIIEASFNYDLELQKAVEVLQNSELYHKTLQKK